ncbi:AfsR/SARP family transcriptional regulator [Ktedonobacter racemifer]|uniref:AfsR/SARP family transcriptional regulator n=1 Tax=Ktedonobacter racemifer TaxID=363277 RepID=UPI00146CB4C5|nr:BTAD domain-containing putative transcriptional regulator [Ktedonobacter racemifer]
MRIMHDADGFSRAGHPLMRITTLGEFTLERFVPTPLGDQDGPPRYVRVARSEWGNRGPAMTLLKVLLCRAQRRATRGELIEAIWPDHEAINAAHALDSAASVLRRHILRTGEVGGMLLTLRSGGETVLKLPGQHRLWVDADAFLSQVSGAMRIEHQGQSPIPLLEDALALARGEFLEDDLYAEWAQGRRHTINGARHRALFKLVDLYLKCGQVSLAEEWLFAALEEDPADEDALCRLMTLLAEQGRRGEAFQLYQYTEDVLQEEQSAPAAYTREVARRVRQGLALHEQVERYTASEAQVPAMAPHPAPPWQERGYWGDAGMGRATLAIMASSCRGQTATPYRYHTLPRRVRRRPALPTG